MKIALSEPIQLGELTGASPKGVYQTTSPLWRHLTHDDFEHYQKAVCDRCGRYLP